jgi:hypothetical protein
VRWGLRWLWGLAASLGALRAAATKQAYRSTCFRGSAAELWGDTAGGLGGVVRLPPPVARCHPGTRGGYNGTPIVRPPPGRDLAKNPQSVAWQRLGLRS